jgi:hypothetical protein
MNLPLSSSSMEDDDDDIRIRICSADVTTTTVVSLYDEVPRTRLRSVFLHFDLSSVQYFLQSPDVHPCKLCCLHHVVAVYASNHFSVLVDSHNDNATTCTWCRKKKGISTLRRIAGKGCSNRTYTRGIDYDNARVQT